MRLRVDPFVVIVRDWLVICSPRVLYARATTTVLVIVLSRMYTLRNQLIHGGATWNSRVNRDQIRDGANILGDVVPIVIHLMMENAQGVWGEACYPVVE